MKKMTMAFLCLNCLMAAIAQRISPSSSVREDLCGLSILPRSFVSITLCHIINTELIRRAHPVLLLTLKPWSCDLLC